MFSPFAAALAYIPRFLLLGLWIAAAVFALTNYTKHPLKSIFVLIAIAIQIVNALSSWGMSFIVPLINDNGARMSTTFMIIGAIQTFLNAIAWALILAALFFVPQKSVSSAVSDNL